MRSTITAIQMGIEPPSWSSSPSAWPSGPATPLGLVDLHQLIGILIVLGLWTQAVLAARPACSRAWWPPCGAWS